MSSGQGFESSLRTPVVPPGFDVPAPAPRKVIMMNFLEGARPVTLTELRDNDITRNQVTKFYSEQIRQSGHYDRSKHIVEPSMREFVSPGKLDTSGEGDNTVVPGLQHKYPQTGLMLVTDRCASYCRYCFRKRHARIAAYIQAHTEMNNVLLSEFRLPSRPRSACERDDCPRLPSGRGPGCHPLRRTGRGARVWHAVVQPSAAGAG